MKLVIIDEQQRTIINLTKTDIGFDGETFYCDADNLKKEFPDTESDIEEKIFEGYVFEFMSELFEIDVEVLKKGWEG